MNKFLYFIGTLLFSTLFCSCEKEIIFKDEMVEQFIVVNGFCEAGNPISISLVASKPLSGIPNDFTGIDSAKVILFVDNVETEELFFLKEKPSNYDYSDSSAYEIPFSYKSKTICEPGKKYRLEISHPHYEPVSCETTIPPTNETFYVDTINSNSEFVMNKSNIHANLKFRFTDPSSEVNYYRFIINYQKGSYLQSYNPEKPDKYNFVIVLEKNNMYSYTIDDPILFPENDDPDDFLFGSNFNRYNIFTDEMINGQTHEINIDVKQDFYNEGIPLYKGEFVRLFVTLQSITKDEYLYLESLNSYNENKYNFLSEPVPVYTNVNNGKGIFAGANSISKTYSVGEYPLDGINYLYAKNGSVHYIIEDE